MVNHYLNCTWIISQNTIGIWTIASFSEYEKRRCWEGNNEIGVKYFEESKNIRLLVMLRGSRILITVYVYTYSKNVRALKIWAQLIRIRQRIRIYEQQSLRPQIGKYPGAWPGVASFERNLYQGNTLYWSQILSHPLPSLFSTGCLWIRCVIIIHLSYFPLRSTPSRLRTHVLYIHMACVFTCALKGLVARRTLKMGRYGEPLRTTSATGSHSHARASRKILLAAVQEPHLFPLISTLCNA